VVPDLAERLPGRGYWVSADAALLRRAVEKQAFARAARRPVQVQRDLPEQVAELLRRRCIELVSLARRAGGTVAGFEKVAAALAQGRVAVLLAAIDGAADGRRKLAGRAAGLPFVAALSAADLGLAFGRESVVHAALGPGGLADRFVMEARRLEGVRATPEADGAATPSTDASPGKDLSERR